MGTFVASSTFYVYQCVSVSLCLSVRVFVCVVCLFVVCFFSLWCVCIQGHVRSALISLQLSVCLRPLCLCLLPILQLRPTICSFHSQCRRLNAECFFTAWMFLVLLWLLSVRVFLGLLCVFLSVWSQVGPDCVQFPRSPPAAAAGYKSAEARDLQTSFEWKVVSSIHHGGSVPVILFSGEFRLIGAHVHSAPGGERGVGKVCSWWQSAAEGMQEWDLKVSEEVKGKF